jgi:hypothetical protein
LPRRLRSQLRSAAGTFIREYSRSAARRDAFGAIAAAASHFSARRCARQSSEVITR